MKEIIYLDTKLVNSFLAQLNEGLLTKLINESSDSKSNTEGASTSTQKSSGVGFSAGVSGNLKDSEEVTDSKELIFSTSNKDLIETALDDYSLDVLINNLTERNLLKSQDYSIGDIVTLEDVISTMNFERINKSAQIEVTKDMIPEFVDFLDKKETYNKLKNKDKLLNKNVQLKNEIDSSEWNNFQILKNASAYMGNLFPDNTLIKIADTLSICSNELFRVSEAQLTFLNYTPRNAKIIGIISSKFNETMPAFENELEVEHIFKNAPNILSNIMLGSNQLITAGDFIIRPIAIYFEY